MSHKRIIFCILGVAVLSVTGCSKSQVITGQLDLQSFPSAPQAIKAVGETKTVEAPVAADGSYRLELAPGSAYRLDFTDKGSVIYPRRAGTVNVSFRVAKVGSDFDMGKVRYIGDPKVTKYAFKSKAGTVATADGDDVECEDGSDPDGNVCVDDDEEDACDEGDEGDEDDGDVECQNGVAPDGTACADDGADGADDDDIQCADGVDPAGQPCEEEDDEEAGDGGAGQYLPDEAAVAEHNPPSSMGGCGDDNDDEENENEDEDDDD